MASWSRPRRPGRFAALGFATALHVVVLAALGLVQPHVEAPYLAGAPPMQVSLLTTPMAKRTASAPPSLAPRASPRVSAVAPPPSALAGAAAAADPPPVRKAEAEPGCEQEVLILLNAAERERCRNQIETETARRKARDADADAARRVQEARRAGPIDNLAPDKRAAYDAIQQAKAAKREDFSMKGLPRRGGLGAGNDGIDINVGVRCTMALGGGRGIGRPSCRVAPPGAALSTETTRRP